MNWQQLIQTFGYPIVALGIGLESMGIPAPGETILIIGAAIAATGQLNIVAVILSAATGAIIGDNIAFSLGRRHGQKILSRLHFIDDEKLAKSKVFFAKHGHKTVFMARFVPFLRMIVAYLAGINKMPARIFFLYNMLGGVTWAIAAGSVGYFFGRNLHIVDMWLHRIGVVSAVVIGIALLLLWVNHRWRGSERSFWASRTGYWLAVVQRLWLWIIHYGKKGVAVYISMLVGGGWIFGMLVDDWVEREPELYARDHFLTTWLKGGVSELPIWLDWLSFLGDVRVLVVIGIGVVFWQMVTKNKFLIILSVFNIFGALLVGVGLQILLRRPLPPVHDPVWQLTAYSFPHLSSFLGTAVYSWTAYVWGRNRNWQARVHIGTISSFMIFTIALFGLFTGQAHLTDVIAGAIMGGLWFGVFWGILQLINRTRDDNALITSTI